MAPTSFATAPRSLLDRKRVRPRRKMPISRAPRSGVLKADPSNEPVTAVHPAAGGNDLADDRHHAFRHAGVPISAGRGTSGSGLSDHPGSNLLPRRQPRRDDV